MTIEERLYSKTKISKKFGIIRALDEEGKVHFILWILLILTIGLFLTHLLFQSAEKMAKAREETLARDQKRLEEKRKAKSAVPLW